MLTKCEANAPGMQHPREVQLQVRATILSRFSIRRTQHRYDLLDACPWCTSLPAADDRPPQAAKSRIKAFRKLGTIKVTLHRALKIASAASRYKELERRHDVDSVETQSIPEKRLKGRAISVHAAYVVQHCPLHMTDRTTRLSLPVPTKRGIPIDWEYPYGKEPFAKFLFKYRSRSMYRSLLLHRIEYFVCRGPPDRGHSPTQSVTRTTRRARSGRSYAPAAA